MSGGNWVTQNADWLSSVFGLFSALVLALPLVDELPKRRRHDAVLAIKRRSNSQAASRPGLEDDSAEVGKIEGEMTSDRMGGYYSSVITVALGLSLLGISFILSFIYAVNK